MGYTFGYTFTPPPFNRAGKKEARSLVVIGIGLYLEM